MKKPFDYLTAKIELIRFESDPLSISVLNIFWYNYYVNGFELNFFRLDILKQYLWGGCIEKKLKKSNILAIKGNIFFIPFRIQVNKKFKIKHNITQRVSNDSN